MPLNKAHPVELVSHFSVDLGLLAELKEEAQD
jgi:hypothetical protein